MIGIYIYFYLFGLHTTGTVCNKRFLAGGAEGVCEELHKQSPEVQLVSI